MDWARAMYFAKFLWRNSGEWRTLERERLFGKPAEEELMVRFVDRLEEGEGARRG